MPTKLVPMTAPEIEPSLLAVALAAPGFMPLEEGHTNFCLVSDREKSYTLPLALSLQSRSQA